MKNVLILNGHQHYDVVAKGELTKSYIDKADSFLNKHGFSIKHTHIEKGYELQEELEKFQWADYIILQFPVYWMSLPWITKKYIDETFTQGIHYENDGRSRTDDTKLYGSGGLMKDKKYMLSLTYNAPESAFNNKDSLFDGLSLDEAHVAVHKTFQFCGLSPLETYSVHDIFKGDLNLEEELIRFESHLSKNFL